jgi:hypothetical protein
VTQNAVLLKEDHWNGQLAPSRMQVGNSIELFLWFENNGIFQNQAEVVLHHSLVG